MELTDQYLAHEIAALGECPDGSFGAEKRDLAVKILSRRSEIRRQLQRPSPAK